MPNFDLSVTMEDAFQRRTTKRFKVFDAVDYAAALTKAGLFAIDLAAITGCDVLSYSLTTVVPYTDTVTAGANLDAGVTFSLSIGGVPAKKGVTKVPAPLDGYIDPDGSVDMADVIVTDYADNFTSGFILVSDGEIVDSFNSGRLDR